MERENTGTHDGLCGIVGGIFFHEVVFKPFTTGRVDRVCVCGVYIVIFLQIDIFMIEYYTEEMSIIIILLLKCSP